MTSLQQQIVDLFIDTEADVRELITRVLDIEKEFLHLKNPSGVMEKINEALNEVASNAIQKEPLE